MRSSPLLPSALALHSNLDLGASGMAERVICARDLLVAPDLALRAHPAPKRAAAVLCVAARRGGDAVALADALADLDVWGRM